ncbi:hypothetical protein ILYODFUR_012491, partial [Ilyodon furcidens]
MIARSSGEQKQHISSVVKQLSTTTAYLNHLKMMRLLFLCVLLLLPAATGMFSSLICFQ